MLVVNASNIMKDFNWITSADRRDRRCRGREHQLALRADRDPGAGGAGRSADADRRQPRRHQVLLVHDRRGRGRARHDLAHRLHRRGRLRGVRAAGVGRARLGRDPPRRARRPASCPPASARATRCASRRRCGSTATTSTRRRPCSRPISAGRSAGRRRSSSATTCCAGRSRKASARKLVGFEVLDRAIARHGHDVYVDEREGRRRHERHADAVPEEDHRHGLPAERPHGTGHRVRDRRPRPARARPGRAAAVLQASAIPDTVITQGARSPLVRETRVCIRPT